MDLHEQADPCDLSELRPQNQEQRGKHTMKMIETLILSFICIGMSFYSAYFMALTNITSAPFSRTEVYLPFILIFYSLFLAVESSWIQTEMK